MLEGDEEEQWEPKDMKFIRSMNDPTRLYVDVPEFLNTDDSFNGIHRDRVKSPIKAFRKLITKKMLQQFVANTNEYADSKNRDGWYELTTGEFQVFIGVILYMGLAKLPHREDYWYGPQKQRTVINSMSYRRFNDIMQSLHYCSERPLDDPVAETARKGNPFSKIDEFVEKLSENSLQNYSPQQFFAIDEQCIPWKGRHKCKQYNPSKPNKWHFKVFTMNCSFTNYMINFYLYKGSAEIRPADVSATNYPAYKLTRHEMFHHKNHVLVTENWFTSKYSLLTMKERGIESIGTMRANKLGSTKRNAFKATKNIKRRSMKMFKSSVNKFFHTTYMDKNVVNMFSTFKSRRTSVKRVNDMGQKETVNIPSIIALYNRTMGAVDGFDQLLQYYFPHSRSKKYHIKVFMHFLYVAVVNSHILYKTRNNLVIGDDMFDLLGYIRRLNVELFGKAKEGRPEVAVEHSDLRYARRGTVLSNPLRLIGEHTMRTFEGKSETSNVDHRRMCKYCHLKKVKTYCLQCGVMLCMGTCDENDCFSKYHNRLR